MDIRAIKNDEILLLFDDFMESIKISFILETLCGNEK
jgi:hypothetical protein